MDEELDPALTHLFEVEGTGEMFGRLGRMEGRVVAVFALSDLERWLVTSPRWFLLIPDAQVGAVGDEYRQVHRPSGQGAEWAESHLLDSVQRWRPCSVQR